jgi:hypothetical protein
LLKKDKNTNGDEDDTKKKERRGFWCEKKGPVDTTLFVCSSSCYASWDEDGWMNGGWSTESLDGIGLHEEILYVTKIFFVCRGIIYR